MNLFVASILGSLGLLMYCMFFRSSKLWIIIPFLLVIGFLAQKTFESYAAPKKINQTVTDLPVKSGANM